MSTALSLRLVNLLDSSQNSGKSIYSWDDQFITWVSKLVKRYIGGVPNKETSVILELETQWYVEEFWLLQNVEALFKNACTTLHCHWQHQRVLICPHPCHHLLMLVWFIRAILVGVKWHFIVMLICISLMDNGTRDRFKIGKGARQGCKLSLSPCLFNLYAEYIMWNTGWMKLKLESRFPGEISITSDMQMAPLSWQKVKRN